MPKPIPGAKPQFSVVREDPGIELEVVRRKGARRILLIASGGCTALTLAAVDPQARITLLDPNPIQLGLVRRKLDALARPRDAAWKSLFNIGDGDPAGLNAAGNFESLFRQFSGFLFEFVAPREFFARLFEEGGDKSRALAEILSSKYWPVAFDLFFSDSLLNAMFGPDATQHAPKGSYPGYFRRALERGLMSPGAQDNYFLHHLLLGHYIDRQGCLPHYLTHSPARPEQFDWIQGTLDQVSGLGRFDLIGLSNIFDWMPEAEATRLARRLCDETRPGSALIYRQLNHSTDFQRLFESRYEFDPEQEASLLASDRSLFYSKLSLGTKRPGGQA
jgi:S-adenosylmethionine-diacylglycerol 3-amino-3-carboxypropyl transferase